MVKLILSQVWLISLLEAGTVFAVARDDPPARRQLTSNSPLEASLSHFKSSFDASSNSGHIVSQKELQRTQVVCMIDSLPSSSSPHHKQIRIEVRHDISPVFAEAFVARVSSGFYDGCYIFRVLKGFIAQFGINPKWDRKEKFQRPKASTDSRASRPMLSNTRGTMNFAGASPTQVFINIGNNARLDHESRPFATLDEDSMAIVDSLYTGYVDGDGQVGAVNRGEVSSKFAEMSWIETCRVMGEF